VSTFLISGLKCIFSAQFYFFPPQLSRDVLKRAVLKTGGLLYVWGLEREFFFLQNLNMIGLNVLLDYLVVYWVMALCLDGPQKIQVYVRVLLNQVLVNLPLSFFLDHIADRFPESTGESWSSWLLRFALAAAIEEALFYPLHRFMHSCKWAYRVIHSQHHEFRHPVALAANYCHPLEHAFCNVLPALTGPLLVGMTADCLRAWLIVANVLSLLTHAGWDDALHLNTAHRRHHLFVNCNFGVLGVLDWICGTRC
jgi:sterol desaturase/sphingolipid hydroxylase (fatty acid hydroxylase superfamily)